MALWSTLLYTNVTPQTSQSFSWVMQLLIVSLQDENLFFEGHPSQVMMQIPQIRQASFAAVQP